MLNTHNITARELDKIVAYLKEHATISIEVKSHTDSKGSDLINMRLSRRRANATAAYIINKGIPSDRVLFNGYGETELINPCKNGVPCTKKQHQQNRRSEFIVIKN